MNRSKCTLSKRVKWGYGAASLGDTAIYNLMMVYALFFLTDVVCVSPMTAGSIIFITMIVNAVTIAVIGYLSDRMSFKNGRRLPYMTAAMVPIVIFTVMMFTVIEASSGVKAMYYLVVGSCLWASHSTYVLPYEALGAELTGDSHERTVLRSYARVFMGIGNLFGMVFILYWVQCFERMGLSPERAWQSTSLIVALVTVLSFLVTRIALRGKVSGYAGPVGSHAGKSIFKEYFQILKLRPMHYLLFVTFCFTVANVFFSSDVVYFMKYNLGLPESLKSAVFFVLTMGGIVMTPVITKAAGKADKKYVMLGCFLFSGVGMALFGTLGISSFKALCAYIAVFTVGSSAYWQLMYSLLYDISEVDESLNGKRREATIMSASKVFLRLSTALSVQFLAGVLFCFGYDGGNAIQTARSLHGIELSLTLFPAVFFFLAAAGIFLYPLTQKKHKELTDRLSSARQGGNARNA